MVASGELPLPVNPENIYPSSDDDEYEDIVVSSHESYLSRVTHCLKSGTDYT